jgi:hypothetical protein
VAICTLYVAAATAPWILPHYVHAAAYRAGTLRVDLHPCMECGVENVETALRKVDEPVQDSVTQYSPGDFLRHFGTVIATCLGLALIAHILVTFVRQY